jgi:histone-lysine N-methyltransferase SETD2
MTTLKILPVTNKTILQDSKVMSVVQKWAVELAMPESSSGETDTERSETPQRVTENTQKVDNSDISDVEFTKPDDTYDKMPHKKRKLFQHIKETDENSSDSDSSKVSGIVNISKVVTVTEQGTESQASSVEGATEPEDKKLEEVTTGSPVKKIKLDESPMDSEVGTPDELAQSDTNKTQEEIKPDLEEGEIIEVKKEATVADVASELLESWSSLKDLFKIPKKEQQEERKRTERELGRFSQYSSSVFSNSSIIAMGNKRS